MKTPWNLLWIFVAAFGVPNLAGAGEAAAPPAIGWPYSSPNSFRMTAAFDLNRNTTDRADWTGWISGDPTAGSGHAYDNHSGTDHGMVNGTNLYAVANGTVTSMYRDFPRDDNSGGGNYLIFSHPVGGQTYRVNFWHLDYQGALVGVGAAVTKGQLVAYSNNTGNSTGPHLHYGISKSSGTNTYTCPFYWAWWENDEFYSQNGYPCLIYMRVTGTATLNCRLGNLTSYDLITSLPGDGVFVSSQHNTWYRLFLPMPPAKARESRAAAGDLAPGYSETGSWINDTGKSSVSDPAADANRVVLAASGSRFSSFSGSGDSDIARFDFQIPQRGNYKIHTTWPSDANAENVTYRITHADGTSDVLVAQRGNYGQGGTGFHADPYIIESNPYVVNHTTIGGDKIWDAYSPAGSGLAEKGPERIYRFELRTVASVTVTVEHTGYPAKDIDIHLLGSMNNNDCIRRADWSFTQSDLAPGTYYISCDSYGNDDSAATDYTLRVTFSETEPFANSWVLLGEYLFAHAGNYAVELLESSVTGPVEASRPGRVYADAIKIVPMITHRSGFASNSYLTRVVTSTEPICCVVVSVDSTTYNDSNSLFTYTEFPIYAERGSGSSNLSAIVGKAVTGQRFVCTQRTADGWYKIQLTNACDSPEGWICGDHLTIYNPAAAALVPQTNVNGWSLY